MDYKEYQAKRRQDPEYRKVAKRMKPWLDFCDWLFRIKMKLHILARNLRKRQRLSWPPPDGFDSSLGKNLQWRELVYCTFGLWPMIIKYKLRGDHPPKSIALIAGRCEITQADVDWAKQMIAELEIK